MLIVRGKCKSNAVSCTSLSVLGPAYFWMAPIIHDILNFLEKKKKSRTFDISSNTKSFYRMSWKILNIENQILELIISILILEVSNFLNIWFSESVILLS